MPRRTAMGLGLLLITLVAIAVAFAPVGRRWLIGAFGPPQVTLREAYSEPIAVTPVEFDHAEFDALLRAHVDSRGKVDYRGLKGQRDRLDAYLGRVGSADFDALGRDQKLALLINAYNAFTLALILDHYPIRSIRDIPENARWKPKNWRFAGRMVSLEEMEHQLIRAKFMEPRVHFALVCGADGCPPLRSQAYDGATIDSQLADQARKAHDTPDWMRLDPDTIALNPIYEWYANDFEQTDGDILRHAAQHNVELQKRLESGESPRIRWLEYDWSLNDQAEESDSR